jgi:TolB-like protein
MFLLVFLTEGLYPPVEWLSQRQGAARYRCRGMSWVPMTTSNPADRLDSWKEIAVYLRRDIRTVQRWEKNEGLPVHRHHHDKLGSIYAYKPELTAWFNAREQPHDQNKNGERIKLAVLPFGDVSGNGDEDYFIEGLAEEMITELTRRDRGNLSVIARATAVQFNSGRASLDRLKNELGVSFVLEGKVRRSGNRVRITTQLIQLKDETQLWAEIYERDIGDVLTVQADIAQAIALNINLALKLPERTRLSESRKGGKRVEPAAYDAYLKGRYNLHQMYPCAIECSIADFERSIQIDGNYAPAHASLASAHALLAIAPFDAIPPHQAMPKAEKAALRALELDGALAEAHTALALVQHHYHWRWKLAESSYLCSIELNPNHASAHLWYSWLLLVLGRRQEAFDEIERTMRIVQETDPHRLVAVHATRAAAFYFGREFQRAVTECEKALELNTGHFMVHYMLGRSQMRLGEHAKAIARFEYARAAGADMPLMDAALGLAYAVTGRFERARQLAETFKVSAGSRYIPPTYIGMLHAGLGNTDEALIWLERAFEQRADGLTWLNVEPMLDELRSDPRFQDLIHRLGFL